jgi:hypothetical protein
MGMSGLARSPWLLRAPNTTDPWRPLSQDPPLSRADQPAGRPTLADVDHQTFLILEHGKWTPTVLTGAGLDDFLERFERDPLGTDPAVDR